MCMDFSVEKHLLKVVIKQDSYIYLLWTYPSGDTHKIGLGLIGNFVTRTPEANARTDRKV